jgi:hypothetical protein
VAADPGGRDTEQHLPERAAEGVFDAGAHAHDHIYNSWTRLTDVANLQPDYASIIGWSLMSGVATFQTSCT